MVGRIRDPLTGSIRSAGSRKESRKNEDRDANPLNDNIGSEVVRRSDRAKYVKQGPSTKALAETDLQAVLSKGSGTREKWLKKALQQVQDGELPAVEVYNILKVPDFSADLKDKTGRSIYRLIMSKLSLFSKGQQRFLAKECPLAQMFSGEGGGQAAGSESTPKAGEEAAEAMMERVREFVRQQQGLELDQAAAQPVAQAAPQPVPSAESAFPMPGMPGSAPITAQSVGVKPPRQDMSAVANILARASSAALKSEAVASVAKTAPPAQPEAPQAEAAPPSKKPEDKREERSNAKQRAASSSSSRPRGRQTKRRRSPSSSRSRSRSPSRTQRGKGLRSDSRDGRRR